MTPTVEPIVQPGMRPDTFFYHIENGFYFHESGKRHGNIYFKCVHAGKACRGRATYDPFAGFSMNGQHNHDPDPHYGDEIALMRKILARSLGNASFKSILLEEGRRFAPEVVQRVTYARMRTPMRIARLRVYPMYPHPSDIDG